MPRSAGASNPEPAASAAARPPLLNLQVKSLRVSPGVRTLQGLGGASGPVGSEVARLLKEAGHKVRTTTRKSPASPDQVQVDLLTGKGLDAAFEGVQRAFFLSPGGYPDQYGILAPLIRKAKAARLEKVVLMTAIGVEANDAAPMRRAEIDLEQSGLTYGIIRPSWFMQNFQTFWQHDIREHGAIRLAPK